MELIYSLNTLENCPKQIKAMKQLVLSICGKVTMSANNTGTQTYVLHGENNPLGDLAITIHTELPQSVIRQMLRKPDNLLLENMVCSSAGLYSFVGTMKCEYKDLKLNSSLSADEYYDIVQTKGSTEFKEYIALQAIVKFLDNFHSIKIKVIEVATLKSNGI